MTTESPSSEKLNVPFLALLSGLTALGQFATSVYLPSLPSIGRDFSASVQMVQLTLLAYLVCFAVFQLLWGPLADRFGRKPIVYAGIIGFVGGSAVSFLAPTIAVLIAGRALQAVGGSATIVAGRAIVRDTHSGGMLAQALAIITIIFSAAPALAPLIGGVLEVFFGWRSTFLAAAALGLILLAFVTSSLKETHRVRPASMSVQNVFDLYAPLLRSARFLGYVITSAFAMGGLYVFFSGGPQLFINELHVSPAEYGVYPTFTVLGFVAGGIIARRMTLRTSAPRLMTLGLLISLVGGALMLAFPMLKVIHPFVYNACMFVFVSGLGITLTIAIAEALRDFPERAGAASAMVGFLQIMGASLGTVLVGRLAHIEFLAVPIAMVVMSVLGLVYFLAMSRHV